ncbi:MAG: hypothetical protein FD163_2559 [Hyphomonadaceae bacterium]|nr:MAG: hypothetical protein FD163_2559 [Hyphomonadaceae bacterium]
MNGLIGSPTSSPSAAGEDISFGAFWPKITLSDFRDEMRVGNNTIPNPRLKSALSAAALTVEKDLINQLAQWQVEGHSSLATVSSPDYGDETKLVSLWRTAVFAYAAAELIETHRDISATNDGINRADGPLQNVTALKVKALNCIRDIKNKPRVDCELI